MVMVVFGRGAGHRNRVDLLRNASAGRRVASPTELEMHTDVHHHLHPPLEANARAPIESAGTDGIDTGARLTTA